MADGDDGGGDTPVGDDADSAASVPGPADADVVASLPDALRSELGEPMGPVFETPDALLGGVDGPVIAVGDVVVHELVTAGRPPAVAVVDGRTERRAVGDEVAATLADLPVTAGATNPPGTLSAGLLDALAAAVGSLPRSDGAVAVIDVDGEEDLAALPAVVLAPDGAAVVYGQPGEGMVRVTVDDGARRAASELLARFDGDADRLRALLGDAD